MLRKTLLIRLQDKTGLINNISPLWFYIPADFFNVKMMRYASHVCYVHNVVYVLDVCHVMWYNIFINQRKLKNGGHLSWEKRLL